MMVVTDRRAIGTSRPTRSVEARAADGTRISRPPRFRTASPRYHEHVPDRTPDGRQVVARGERGPAWWVRIEERIGALVDARGPEKTVCPSEVARDLAGGGDFRELMPHVREAAAVLAGRGELRVTQRGEPVDARTARGPIRLGRPCDGTIAGTTSSG